MKKSSFKVLVAAILATTACSAQADFWVSAGSSPSNKTSLSLGFKGSDWGLEIGEIFDTEFKENLNDYPVPHSSYIDLGVQKTQPTIGIDVLRFVDLSTQVRMYGEVGIYSETRKHIAQSTVTYWNYTQDDQSRILGVAGLGFQYVSTGGMTAGIGIHSLRGLNISLGAAF